MENKNFTKIRAWEKKKKKRIKLQGKKWRSKICNFFEIKKSKNWSVKYYGKSETVSGKCQEI